MKANKVGQDFNHVVGTKYPMAANTPPYPIWIARLFWCGVAAVFAVVVFGFMQLGG